MTFKKPLIGLVVAGLAMTTLSRGAVSSAATKTTKAPKLSAAGAADLAKAKAATAKNRLGTFRPPPTSGPAIKKDVRVMYISCLELLPSCSEPTTYAKEVAASIGWKIDVRDAQGVASNAIPFVEEAVAGKYSVIIAQSMDCAPSKAAIEKAVAAKIPVVAFYSNDCNDPKSNAGPPLLTLPNYDPSYKSYGEFTYAWGAAKADWLIEKTNGQAKVIELRQDDFLVVGYINDGFEGRLKKCPGCKIVNTVQFVGADIGSGAFAQKVATALQTHPEANSIHFPYDGLMLLGGLTSLKDSKRIGNINVVGGETVTATFDFLRDGSQSMANVFEHEWTVRAAFDTANRALSGEKTFPDSGLGWAILDKSNAPKTGVYPTAFDFKASYNKVFKLS